MDRRWNDLNALRQAREHLLKIDELEDNKKRLNQRMKKEMPDTHRTYTYAEKTTYSSNHAGSLKEKFDKELEERKNRKRERKNVVQKWLKVPIILWMVFLVYRYWNVNVLLVNEYDISGGIAFVYTAIIGGLLCAFIPTWQDYCDWMIRCLKGFGFLVGIGLMHKDLTAENIIGTTLGTNEFIYLGVTILLVALRLVVPPLFSLNTKNTNASQYTAEQEAQLKEAVALDARNADEYKKYVKRMNQEAAQQAEGIRARYAPQIRELERKIYDSYIALQQLDILGKNEQNLSAVNALIDIMESHRADTIPEALRVYDAQRHYHNQVVQAQFNERMNILEQKWQRQEQFDRDMAAAAHRREVEALLQKQLDALEQD